MYIPTNTENGMHIGMAAELVCITFRFDTVPWQTSSGVGTFRPLYILLTTHKAGAQRLAKTRHMTVIQWNPVITTLVYTTPRL
jgi:hypothetical protein